MELINNMRSYFTVSGMPGGDLDRKKLLLGGLALAGIVTIIAASIFGLGLSLVVVGGVTTFIATKILSSQREKTRQKVSQEALLKITGLKDAEPIIIPHNIMKDNPNYSKLSEQL